MRDAELVFRHPTHLNDRLAVDFPESYAGMFVIDPGFREYAIAVVGDQRSIRRYVERALAEADDTVAWRLRIVPAQRTMLQLQEVADEARRDADKILWRSRGLELVGWGIDARRNAVVLSVVQAEERTIVSFVAQLRADVDAVVVHRVRERPRELAEDS